MDFERHLLEYAKKAHNPEARRKHRDVAKRILDYAVPKQRDFILDNSPAKAALCPRRSGKSIASLLAALYKAVTIPRAKVLVIARVRRQVKGVYWGDLKHLAKLFDLPVKLRINELTCTIESNESLIEFTGADTQEEIDKFRGQGYDLVIIDEAKSYSSTLLHELIQEIIMPALTDRLGQMIMIGTPGAVLAGSFYEVTAQQLRNDETNAELVRPWWAKDKWKQGQKFLWSLHKWSSQDNIKNPHIWEQALELKERFGWSDNDPTWLREYKGEWVPDDDAMVYPYESANTNGRLNWTPDMSDKYFGLPEDTWHFLVGIDLGYSDDTAFVVAAYGDYTGVLHYIHAEKHSGLAVEEVADRFNEMLQVLDIDPEVVVADTGGLGAMIVASLQRTYGIPVIAAKKTEKHAHIKLLGSDMRLARIRVPKYGVLKPGANPLVEEWSTLQWGNIDPLSPSYMAKEDPSLPNHCADAALYLWRYSHHHFTRDKVVRTKPGTREWHLKREAEVERKAAMEAQEEMYTSRYKKYRRRGL